MNLQRRCLKCRDFFPVEPEELKFFCDKPECQEHANTKNFWSINIKSNRSITLNYFDIHDLDRPILTDGDKITRYERVCRSCGEPLLNKAGKHSYHKRYCGKHSGYELSAKYNWGNVSKDYARKIRDENKELISNAFKEHIKINSIYYKQHPTRIKDEIHNLTICEACGKLCRIFSVDFNSNSFPKRIDVINIHHIQPVHTLTGGNIHLIWDVSNLIALCHECHKNQDHQLKRKSEYQYQNILNYI